MDWTPLSLKTLIPQIPRVVNDNFTATERYLDVFYNGDAGVIIKPVNTTGRVKASTGEFVNVITDNFTVKKQFTNWYNNYTTVDAAFLSTYNGGDVSTRIATSDTSTNVIWPLEPSAYSWVDVQTPYIKIDNDASYGFQNNTLGQEVELIFANPPAGAGDFKVLLDVSEGGQSYISITTADALVTSIKLITVAWDASYGPTWVVKYPNSNYTIS